MSWGELHSFDTPRAGYDPSEPADISGRAKQGHAGRFIKELLEGIGRSGFLPVVPSAEPSALETDAAAIAALEGSEPVQLRDAGRDGTVQVPLCIIYDGSAALLEQTPQELPPAAPAPTDSTQFEFRWPDGSIERL